MSLLDDVRTSLRVTSTATDSEINVWIDAAFADMKRCGIKEGLLDREEPDALVKAAVVLFAKANYGFDNSEAPRFQENYKRVLISLLNSKANEYLEQ